MTCSRTIQSMFGLILQSLIIISIPVTALADADTALKSIDRSIRLRQYDQAATQLQPLLEIKNPQAQYRMAGLYRSGKGVKKDTRKALELYREAAISGVAEAQYALASLLEKQQSSPDKMQTIIKWYTAATAQGHRQAKLKLARLKNSPVRNPAQNSHESILSAIRLNQIDKIKNLVSNHVNLEFIDQQQRSPLMVSLLSQHIEIARLILPHSQQYIDTPDMNKNRPLHIAALNGYAGIVEKLISHHVDIDAQDGLGNTALLLATRHNDSAVMDVLLRHHANPEIANKKNQTPLTIAQTLKLDQALQRFAAFHIELPAIDKQYSAIDIDAFRRHIDKTGSIYKGWPMINIAALLGETAIIQQLLDQGADINRVDAQKNTALHQAVNSGQLKTIKLLVARGINLNAVNNKHETALFVAAGLGKLNIVRYLLGKGSDASIKAHSKTTALENAIINRHPATSNLLANAKLDRQGIHHALLLAIKNRMEKLALKLIARDEMLNTGDAQNRTALWHSADQGLQKTTQALLDKAAATINLQDNNGYSALAQAALRGHQKIFDLLIENDADSSVITNQKNNLLMLAILSGNNAILQQALALNVDFNARNKTGDTPLMLAAARGNMTAVKLLIEARADIQMRNHNDLNAYQLALANDHPKTAEYIRAHSGRLFKLFN